MVHRSFIFNFGYVNNVITIPSTVIIYFKNNEKQPTPVRNTAEALTKLTVQVINTGI